MKPCSRKRVDREELGWAWTLRRACFEFANGEWQMANGKWRSGEVYVNIDGDGDGDNQDKGENEGNNDGGGQIPVRNPAGLLKAEKMGTADQIHVDDDSLRSIGLTAKLQSELTDEVLTQLFRQF